MERSVSYNAWYFLNIDIYMIDDAITFPCNISHS